MEALIIFGFFLGLIIKHFGACTKEGYEIGLHRQQALKNGEDTYYAHGYRNTATGHLISKVNEGYLGYATVDQVTGMKTYTEVQKLMDKFEMTRDTRVNGADPTMWWGRLNGNIIYIDKETKQICYLACAKSINDEEHSYWDKDDTYFYVAYDDRSKIIKKTTLQLERDREKTNSTYSIEELKGFVDKCGGSREPNGDWKPISFEPW